MTSFFGREMIGTKGDEEWMPENLAESPEGSRRIDSSQRLSPSASTASSAAPVQSSNDAKAVTSVERQTLRAKPGDRLVIRGHHLGEPEQDGEILKVVGDGGAPPYLVRWQDGRESEVFPGSDAYVQHFKD